MSKEKKILEAFLKRMAKPKVSFWAKRWGLVPLWILLSLGIFLILRLHHHHILNEFWFMASALLLGLVGGAVSVFRSSEQCWPFLVDHISKESIERRIKEIDA